MRRKQIKELIRTENIERKKGEEVNYSKKSK
jgi:hypothetical protein